MSRSAGVLCLVVKYSCRCVADDCICYIKALSLQQADFNKPSYRGDCCVVEPSFLVVRSRQV